jgi:hypothetical protein
MEEILPGKMEYNLEFKGEGKWNRNRQLAFNNCYIGNLLSLGENKTSNFMFGQTTLNDDALLFMGKEMFGFIKVIILFAILFGILSLFIYLDLPSVGLISFYLIVANYAISTTVLISTECQEHLGVVSFWLQRR